MPPARLDAARRELESVARGEVRPRWWGTNRAPGVTPRQRRGAFVAVLVLLAASVGVGLVLVGIRSAPPRGTSAPASKNAPRLWRGVSQGKTTSVTDPNRAAATKEGGRLMGMVTVPPGSRPVSRPPTGSLDTPGSSPGTPNLVDLYQLWTTDGTWQEVQAWIVAHQPTGSTQKATGTSSLGTVLSSSLTYAYPAIANRFSDRQLVMEVAPLPRNRVGIRVDAQVVWYPSRPRAELISTGTTSVTATVFTRTTSRPPTTHVLDKTTFSSPTIVTRLARKVDALPLVIPGSTLCPDTGPVPQLELEFSGGRRVRKVVVRDDPAGCGTVSFTVGQRTLAPLTDDGLIQEVEQLLGVVPPGALPASVSCPTESVTEGTATRSVPCPSVLVTLPDVVGMSTPSAAGELSALGVFTDVVNVPSSSVPRGVVVASSPAAGTYVSARSTVTIENSLGPDPGTG